MSKSTRAKFICEEIIKKHRFEGAVIKLVPVMGGSEENKSFWQYTPAGEITLNITNERAIELFKLGEEYYVDFTSANESNRT